MLDAIHWQTMFAIDTPLIEIFIRGTVIYLGMFLMLRVVLKRQTGGISTTDVLVIVMLADAAQNGMAGTYQSIPDGLMLVGTIIFWSYAIDWLGFHFPWLEKWLEPAPLPLIRNGIMLRRNMRHELITTDEMWAHLRAQGIEDMRIVKLACIEADGKISIITR